VIVLPLLEAPLSGGPEGLGFDVAVGPVAVLDEVFLDGVDGLGLAGRVGDAGGDGEGEALDGLREGVGGGGGFALSVEPGDVVQARRSSGVSTSRMVWVSASVSERSMGPKGRETVSSPVKRWYGAGWGDESALGLGEDDLVAGADGAGPAGAGAVAVVEAGVVRRPAW